MSRNYNELLKVAYELEGLLLMQSQRADDAVAAVDSLIAEKISILSDAFNAAPAPDAPLQTCVPECSKTDVTADNESIADSAIAEEEMMAAPPEPGYARQHDNTTPAAADTTVENEATIMNEAIETPLSLDEKLARERARDIFRAFTLNDKFRFRRELFRNSQEEFDEALNVISQMSTIEEAQEYIYDDLCWDPDNEDVKAFMDVVTKHF